MKAARGALVVIAVATAGCPVQEPGLLAPMPICNMLRNDVAVIQADVLSWGILQHEPPRGKVGEFDATPLQLGNVRVIRGFEPGEVLLDGAISSDGISSIGVTVRELGDAGDRTDVYLFLCDAPNDALLVNGYFKQGPDGGVHDDVRYQSGLALDDFLGRIQAPSSLPATEPCPADGGG